MGSSGTRGWKSKAVENVGLKLQSCAIAALALVCLVPACGQGADQDAGGEDEQVGADGVLLCPSPSPDLSTESSVYVLPAMNNKLRHFPEFAATTGLDAVRNCAEGRQFMRKYRDYLSAFPGFDLGEPDDTPDPELPEEPEVTEEELVAALGTVPKIKNGVGDRLSPVVRITPLINGAGTGGGECTGTFVARNWIMTAAHCLQTASGWHPGLPTAAAKVRKYYEWGVEFFTVNGDPDGRGIRLYKSVLQSFDKRWVGLETSLPVNSFDFAMLYVRKTVDGALPNNEPGLSISNDPFMRVAVSSVLSASSAQFWGAGQDGTGNLSAGLRKGSLSPYQATFAGAVDNDPLIDDHGFLYRAFVPSGSAAYLCRGDSGGPIIDFYNIRNPQTNLVESRYAAFGVFSSLRSSSNCADVTGDRVTWVRTHDEAEFIQNQVAKFYPRFRCKRGLREGGGPFDEYLECWGKPCKDDSVCATGEFCSRPGSELTNCNCPGGGCGCMYGQCLPK